MSPLAEPGDTGPLSAWIAALRYEDLPAAVVASVKASLLDTLAVAFAARDAAGMAAVRRAVLEDGGAPQSALWGLAQHAPAAVAAFHNGSLAAALDYDSLHEHTSHADAVVLPAALAVAEAAGASGRDLLVASAAGTELVYRLGRAAQPTRGWFRTSVYGVFGAAAAAARLWQLDSPQTQAALGLALGQAAGTQQGHIERRLSKRLQSALAARGGVESARLARLGISGPLQPFEGRFGLYALYDAGSAADAFDDLGRSWLLPQVSFKKYPSCGCAHAATEAAVRLAQPSRFDADAIERVEVLITPYMDRLVGAPYSTEGDAEVTGQFCAQYAVAAALARGRFTLADIEPAAVHDGQLRPLIERVRVVVDTEATGRMGPATVRVWLRNGQALQHTVQALPGDASNPLDAAQREAKARDALRHGGLSDPAAQTLIDRVQKLDTLPRAGALLEGLSVPA